MVTSPLPSTTELENQIKVQKISNGLKVSKNLFCRMVFHLQLLKYGTSQIPYLNFQFPNFILEKFLNFILHIIYMSVFLNLETTYENKYINNYLISV